MRPIRWINLRSTTPALDAAAGVWGEGKWAAFISRFFVTSGHSKRFTELPHIHPFLHTCALTSALQATANSQRVRSSEGEASGMGMEPATLRLPAHPAHLLPEPLPEHLRGFVDGEKVKVSLLGCGLSGGATGVISGWARGAEVGRRPRGARTTYFDDKMFTGGDVKANQFDWKSSF